MLRGKNIEKLISEGGDVYLEPKSIRLIRVTVQFETEGNGQNEIVSHMDRSEVKL